MIGLEKICAREDCGSLFAKGTHNQKYCSNECCKIQTNRNIMAQYHKNKAIRNGLKRTCARCDTSLSRYNGGRHCGACETTIRKENLGEATALVGSVSWL